MSRRARFALLATMIGAAIGFVGGLESNLPLLPATLILAAVLGVAGWLVAD